ncbi:MAG: metal ABC transporter permease [Oscillospiraceae bacterium]|nr:metal ABC transporter permease [Oscillospiraceae bacterium]
MTDVLGQIGYYLTEFTFVRYAMVVGILIALCSSLLGVTLVLKRLSFIGDGLSHVAFGATAIAAAINLSGNMLIVLPITVLSAVLLLRSKQGAVIKGDAALAMISVSSLAIGYLIMNVFSKSSSFSSNLSADVCTTLFGSTSILTLSESDVIVCAAMSVAVIAVFLFSYHRIFSLTFDEDFAAATGGRVKAYNLLLAAVIAVVIVVAMNLVGALLISALVIFPALSAMRVFRSFKSVTICSVAVSAICTTVGILASIVVGTPVGSTIVAVYIVGFGMLSAAGSILRRS